MQASPRPYMAISTGDLETNKKKGERNECQKIAGETGLEDPVGHENTKKEKKKGKTF